MTHTIFIKTHTILPRISPTPIKIPERPIRLLALSPKRVMAPMDVP